MYNKYTLIILILQIRKLRNRSFKQTPQLRSLHKAESSQGGPRAHLLPLGPTPRKVKTRGGSYAEGKVTGGVNRRCLCY